MKIGVFALQGAFFEHARALEQLGVQTAEIRKRSDFNSFDGVILPGGESTVQGKLLREEGLLLPLKSAIEGGMPVFGTCAGLILLAKRISNDSNVYLGTMSVTVKRNAYGRQLGSFKTIADMGSVKDYPMVFIRAPYIESVGEGVEVLSRVDGNIVAARERNMLVTAFHPELTDDLRVHRYFLEHVVKGQK